MTVNKMSRINNIIKYTERNERKENEKREISLAKIEKYKKQIRELKPRIDELIEVGNACLEHKIPLKGQSFGCHEGYETHQFISNGWSHLVGFIDEGSNKPFTKVGKIGGGACNWNLTTDGITINVEGDVERVLKYFLDGFNSFETEFYAYIDKVTAQ